MENVKHEMMEKAQLLGIENLSEKDHMRLLEELVGAPKGSLDAFEGLREAMRAGVQELEKIVGREAALNVKAVSMVGNYTMGLREGVSNDGIEEILKEGKGVKGVRIDSEGMNERMGIGEGNSIKP